MTWTFSHGDSIWEHNLKKISFFDFVDKVKNGRFNKTDKTSRPFVSAGCYKENRLLNENFVETNVIGFDLDKSDDAEGVFKFVSNLPIVLFAFISPSGNGVKFFCPLPSIIHSQEIYRYAYQAYVEWFKEKFNLVLDGSSGARRLCFLSHHSEAYVNKFAIPLPEPHIEIPETKDISYGEIVIPEHVIEVLRDSDKSYDDWFKIASALSQYQNGEQIFKKICSNERLAMKKFNEIKKNIGEISIGTLYYVYNRLK